MSVRKSCENCAHVIDEVCTYGMYEILKDPNDCPQWSLSGKNKSDLLHDADMHYHIFQAVGVVVDDAEQIAQAERIDRQRRA